LSVPETPGESHRVMLRQPEAVNHVLTHESDAHGAQMLDTAGANHDEIVDRHAPVVGVEDRAANHGLSTCPGRQDARRSELQQERPNRHHSRGKDALAQNGQSAGSAR
jgi:hypothetical protein